MNSGDSNIREGVYSLNGRSYHLGRDCRESKVVLAAARGSTEALRSGGGSGQKGQLGRAEKLSQVCCLEPVRTEWRTVRV